MAMQNGIEVEQAQSVIYEALNMVQDEVGDSFYAEMDEHVTALAVLVGTCSSPEEMEDQVSNFIIELAQQPSEKAILIAQRMAAHVVDELRQFIM